MMSTEKTDAELLRELVDCIDSGEPPDTTIITRGREYLSGTRPMPTDEVAALTARVAELEAELATVKNALRLFVSAGSGQSTDFLKQGRAFGAAHKALHPSQYNTAPGGEGGAK